MTILQLQNSTIILKFLLFQCFFCVACGKNLVPGDCFALKDDGLYCNEHHKICDKLLDTSDNNGENNNNKNIQNHNRDLSEDGDDKSEEGKNLMLTCVNSGVAHDLLFDAPC